MLNWWRDLSVTKKLYAVVGIMALLIATELLTLLFAMDVLSAVRSFVGGEGLWSKAQKNAVQSLHRYAFTHDPKHYAEFHRHLQVNLGDRAARHELAKREPNYQLIQQGFVQGGNHPDDVKGLVKLVRRFYWVAPIANALVKWREADEMIDELLATGDRLDRALRTDPNNTQRIGAELLALDSLNDRFTAVEVQFSEILGAGSRWLEMILMLTLVCAVLTIESTGLFLTISFSRNLSQSLGELAEVAKEVGHGRFGAQAPVHSKDELGQLAESINKMSLDLQNSLGERLRAENANQVKSQFLANMSHEIRAPLGVMLGLTEILKDPKLPWADHLRYVDTIERTGKNLIRIINDILDLSKVEAGHLEIQKTRFGLAEFMHELFLMLNVQAQATKNHLEFKAEGELPGSICTDRTRLRQILVNLVNNALKYTQSGQVTVAYGLQGEGMRFTVVDNGRGITEQDRQNLFAAFVRAPDSDTIKQEGTGLGLMLAKKLSQALGGDVRLVKSAPGEGSVFEALVAAEPQAQTPSVSPKLVPTGINDSLNLNGRRILVVEDSEDNQLLVKLFLTREGLQVDFANNGQEGIDQALSQDYDAILMDMQMPVKDGYRATTELRQMGYAKPIIALTAHAMKDDRERCLRAGCTDYLTKPVDSKALTETIARHVNAAHREDA